jgi:hypothetical protein
VRRIARIVPSQFAYVPGPAPAAWRYRSWDTGRETPTLFPRGRGLNIWFTTPHPSGAGFHVFADRRCSRERPTRRFRVRRAVVSWSSNFGDARVWRCVRSPHATVRLSVSYVEPARSLRIAVARARRVALMVAAATHIVARHR